jgi:hypothetical protein
VTATERQLKARLTPGLREDELRAAIGYYKRFPGEIDAPDQQEVAGLIVTGRPSA